ncbi:integrin alpha-X-like, partial [Cetorhinus maximus]
IVVSAPLARHGNVTGAVYKCEDSSHPCMAIPIPESPGLHIEGVGLGLTANPSSPQKLLMCAPLLSYTCGSNTYVNGICYEFDSSLTPTRNFTPAFQDCPKPKLDVAFLIDGSGSIASRDFTLMKQFMMSVIRLFEGKDVQFSVSQFSLEAKTEFDFNKYKKVPDHDRLINRIQQMNSVTFTPTGIKHVTDQIFEESSGARNDAQRVMIVITDGESNDVDVTFAVAIRAAERKGILRYAIGVRDAFDTSKATEELETIASRPSVDFVFKVSNFEVLKELNNKLKDKIFAIEGTGKSSGTSTFKLELAQTGFSSIFTSDSITLGAVGAFDWTGALVKLRDGKEVVVNESATQDMANAYLGYTMVEARRQGQRYCIVGAPRYKHFGRVVIFKQELKTKQWTVKQNIDGEQIGSYFGMTLCAVDLEGDGWTDLVLIGAPLYHHAGIGGTVNVCRISTQGDTSCFSTLRGQEGNSLGRFGSSIAALGDLNGDGFRDVAVGAPLENGHQGSVYIYHGVRGGISTAYSQ